jgi:hypothetical protein
MTVLGMKHLNNVFILCKLRILGNTFRDLIKKYWNRSQQIFCSSRYHLQKLLLFSGYEMHIVFIKISHLDRRYILIVFCTNPVLFISLWYVIKFNRLCLHGKYLSTCTKHHSVCDLSKVFTVTTHKGSLCNAHLYWLLSVKDHIIMIHDSQCSILFCLMMIYFEQRGFWLRHQLKLQSVW